MSTYCASQKKQKQINKNTVYWTLRARAETPWCQSLSSPYFGPITKRVVGLFTLPTQEEGEEKENEEVEEKEEEEE